jgi:hypothetical protein
VFAFCGRGESLRKNAGNPQRLQRSSRQFWQDVAADCGWQTSPTEDAGAEHSGRERPGTPQGVLAPKNGDKPASELFLVSAWEFWRCNSMQRCRLRP